MADSTDHLTDLQWLSRELPGDEGEVVRGWFVGDLLALVEWTTNPDPEIALRGVDELRRWIDTAEETAVRSARSTGWSWGRIAESLNRSKQGVHQKYRYVDEIL